MSTGTQNLTYRAGGYRRRKTTLEARRPLEEAVWKDNVKGVLDWYAHYNQGDGQPSLDYWHESAEYRAAREDPDSATHRGIDAIGRLFATWREVYPDLRVEVKEARANLNRVFAWIRFVGRGAASGIPIHMELAHVFTMREGKTARLEEYMDRTEAMEAAGLETRRAGATVADHALKAATRAVPRK